MGNSDSNDFMRAGANLHVDEALDPAADTRYVKTWAARGMFNFHHLLRQLQVEPETLELKTPSLRNYVLFTGHVGGGKSTELRGLAKDLDHSKAFFVVFLDVLEELDVNDLRYVDILLALAAKLFGKLEASGIPIDRLHLTALENWFKERVRTEVKEKAFGLGWAGGAKVSVGVPGFAKLFATLTSSIRYNATYKEELRETVRNGYSELSDAFNRLVATADEAVAKAGRGVKILFVIDGTDRIRGDDARRFFIEDVHQLQVITSNFIYVAPIHFVGENRQLQQRYDLVAMMPMIKIREKDDPNPIPVAYEAMREMVYRRVDRSLFDDEKTVDYLIEHSGGHPRDLVRLLKNTYLNARAKRFDRAAAEKAVRALANDFKRFLTEDDYRLIHRVDTSAAIVPDPRVHFLLQNLALLEYNDFWWLSHPAVRTLEGYRQAAAADG